ncbi:hypothetical protein AY599_23590 [Leptolyngbya valderiana BDU 20041]|nr:hypothetical protein AY599_23590 [Leptolyngbya valderiana BDU 20041]
MLMYPNFRTALREHMRARSITNIELARRVDAHPVTISKLLNGRAPMTDSWMETIADALGTSVRAIWEGEVPGEQAPATTPPPARPRPPDMLTEVERKSLPVYGLAAASPLGNLMMSAEPIEWIEPPPVLDRVRDAYALIVTGDSMVPRYEAGDMIAVHPYRPVRQGDHVVIQEAIEGGTRVSIKRFEKIDETHIHATQYNPPAHVTFRRDQVMAMHRVLTPNEILGV